ncbi:hypothetical protein CR513_14863, partial [Mucuna pruriens]
MFRKIPKYAKFLKELCVHKRGKMKEKGRVELSGIVSALTKNEAAVGSHQNLPKKCRDPEIFSITCAIGECTFTDTMLDLGASINVIPTSVYKSLNFGDLEPTRMTIQLANRSVVQPLGVLEDLLVQVNELIFPTDFHVLDMEDETSGKGSTLILGQPFFMTSQTKIDIHARTLLMEFGDNLVQFNIFEAIRHPTEDHSLFGIYIIDELVVEHLQLEVNSAVFPNFFEDIDEIDCLGYVTYESDYGKLWEVQDLFDSEDDTANLADLDVNFEFIVCKYEELKCLKSAELQVTKTKKLLSVQVATIFTIDRKQSKAEIKLAHLVPNLNQVGQLDPKPTDDISPSPPQPIELKPLPSHLHYAYLGKDQWFPMIIANNLHQEQEEKLLQVLRQHKKAIGWKLSDLPSINPSICIHRILMVEEAHPIRQQQRRLNSNILDMVKKEVTKLLAF